MQNADKTRQRMALEEMNNISRLKRKKGLKRKITQNAIRRTAVPHALQRTHFALRAEKRGKTQTQTQNAIRTASSLMRNLQSLICPPLRNL